ncbi:uncharacterized protein LOC117111682 isoform X2 [Anneissia japonica]|uniref:uncharacterized protein LOC117111682 isoform X2 n=1 Tax=Anneissia japonica TaxID=1529436 RepID=UPI001425884F|nr:uncharacterized protein LOC117111682 isoform X2 [Anneissia japonica]
MAQPNDNVIVIDCGGEITCNDIHNLKNQIGIDSDDVRLIDEALNLLCDQPKRIFRDAEIGFLMKNQCYSMHSGAQTNKYLIFFGGESGQAAVKLREAGWELFIKKKAMAIWNWVTENPDKVIGLVQLIAVVGGLRAVQGNE